MGEDDEDRAEDLFSCHGGIVADPDDQRRIDEEPPGLLDGTAPAHHDGAALVARHVDVALHPVALAGIDERTADGAGVGRVPGGQVGERGGGDVDGVVEVRSRDDEAGRDGTSLPGVHTHREGGHPAGAAQVGVVEDHERRLPAELEEHAFERARRVGHHRATRWPSSP